MVPPPIKALCVIRLFFFQAEDGIRDYKVTGVQTCALPISIVLGKALGIGILSAALKKGALPEEGYRQMLATTTQLNTVGHRLAETAGVHAMTDVTGFGLLGHLAEICRGSRLRARVAFESLPVLPAALSLAQQGYNTRGARRNSASYGHDA